MTVRHVALLGPANSIHLQRWAVALAGRGLRISVISQDRAGALPLPPPIETHWLARQGELGYFVNAWALRRLLRTLRPDLLHAHYASGYGTCAALAGYAPTLLSAWGSDVYDFPAEGRLKAWLLKRNLRSADALASTSHAMASQMRHLVPERSEIAVTPFGIDTGQFAARAGRPPRVGVTIGTVKTLAPKYGIDTLLRAFAELVAGPDATALPCSLLLVGDGPQRGELEALAAALGVAARTEFIGAVPHAQVPEWLNRMDIYVAPSRLDSESFGVAALEASACALPVIVSDAGGLPEVVRHGETGLVVPRDDVPALAAALRQLVAAPQLRQRLGAAGRERVLREYEWGHCVDLMLACYERVAARHGAIAAR